MDLNKNDYPMTYNEYEKRVIELLLEGYSEEEQEILISRLGALLEDDPNFIKGMYTESCFRYDRSDLYGKNSKKVFGNYLLKSIPVNTLEMIIGGSFHGEK